MNKTYDRVKLSSLMKNPLFYIILVLFLSFIVPSHAYADCKCGKAKSVEDSYKESSLVFLGSVISVDKASVLRDGYNVAKIMITVPYKGTEILPTPEVAVVYTPIGGCGLEFGVQNDYLVFATGEPAFLITSSCNLTEIQETSRDKRMKVEKISKGN